MVEEEAGTATPGTAASPAPPAAVPPGPSGAVTPSAETPAPPDQDGGVVDEPPVAEGAPNNSGHTNNYKYRKLLHLFKFNKHNKKNKKVASKHNTLPAVGTPEERRSQLDQDIKNSWDTLPETLRKRKQRVSRALLSEFIDADNPESADKVSPEPSAGEKDDAVKTGSPPLDPEVKEVLDALHRSGVYYDDEDVEDDDEEIKSSSSSSCSEKNEVCVYQVQAGKAQEIVTRAMFHQQDDKDDSHETQIGEEEIYQKINFQESDPPQRLNPVIPAAEEDPQCDEDTAKDSLEPCDTPPSAPCAPPPAPSPAPPPTPPPAPCAPPPEPPKPTGAGGDKPDSSDGDSATEAKSSSSNSSLEYAPVGRSCEESDATTVAADDAVSLYSRPQPKQVAVISGEQPDEKRATTPQPLGLDSEALAAVEMLARAVSSDSLLADSSPCGGSVGSPANSHSSLDNMKLHEDDSGTDVNNPSSSSSSAASSCAGDTAPAVECGEYEDVSPVNVEPKVVNTTPAPPPASEQPSATTLHHHYEAMLVKPEPKAAVSAVYSAIGKVNKPPAPGAQPLPGMYSEEAAAKSGGKPQFLLEALSKRAAAAEQTFKQAKHDSEPYTFMEYPEKAAGTYVKKSQQPRSGSTLLSKSASGCVAALSQLSAQKFPQHLTAPIFYNPLVQCPSPAPPPEAAPCRDDLRPGNKTPCPVFKTHGFEPLPGGGATCVAGGGTASDSEHLTDSFDEDEGMTPSGRPGLVEEPLWRRPADPLSWRTPLEPMGCRRPVTMETIVEEPPSAAAPGATQGASQVGGQGSGRSGCQDDSRLTVREILRRFEELGGKVPSLCDGENGGRGGEDGPEEDEEKNATLREIQETLMNLEEKVRNYQCKMADKSGPSSLTAPSPVQQHQEQQHQQQHVQQQQVQPKFHHHHHHHHHHSRQRGGGGRLESFQAEHRKDGWTGRVQQSPPQPSQQAQPQQPHPGHGPHGAPHGPLGGPHGGPHGSHSPHGPSSMPPPTSNGHHSNGPSSLPTPLSEHGAGQGQVHDGKHSLLQFAIHHFRQSPEKFEMLKTADGSISGSLDVIESLKTKKNKGKSKGNKENEWTWKEQVDLVKFSPRPIEQSLLRLETEEVSELAVECFVCVMRYMGDLPMTTDVTEVKCVYTVLMHCHKHEALRDEVYCQLMKQTTNNKSQQPESCQRGWRLFSIVAAYFACSDTLKPYLFKYLETAAYDKRRAYHGTATVCLQNLRKTFKYGGRKNVPSVEEITAISAGRNSKRQMYRLPGGTERVVNTRSTTVVQDVIEEICSVINVTSPQEMEEFSLYCIVEGDTFTMPLAREEYILDVTTELHKNQQVFYLIFCRSVWHFPLRLDSHLYIEVVFNQIAPDYLEGLLLVMPGETLQQDTIYEIAKMAALLHRAADMTHVPAMKETKFLLPKPALTVRDIKPAQWVNMVQGSWVDVQGLETIQAKAQVLEMLSRWPLFGSSFFAVKRVSDPKERADHILALNRHGVHFIDIVTHETLLHHPFSEVISTRKVKSEDGTLFLDMKCGNLMQQRITRLQTDQAHEISRLIRQYITLQQRVRT